MQINQMLREGKSFSGQERNCFFINLGNGRFANVSAVSGFDLPDDCRGLARVDWDFDGNTDIWVTNRNGPNTRFLRNSIETGNHYVGLRLQGNGVTGNRDAVGARIEIQLEGDSETGDRRRIKTIHAGDAFQTQSSRWVKFGLGKNSSVARIIVHWPDGEKTEHPGIEADCWYVIRQSDASLTKWLPPQIKLDSSLPETATEVADSSISRTLLTRAIPFPPLTFESFDQTQGLLVDAENESRATLVVLWATWCPHCLTELKELQEHQSDLQQAGIRVVALCVDALGDERGATADTARQILERLNLQFAAGPATANIMELLHIVDEYTFDRPGNLPVPASFLFEADSDLVAVYKGPVTPEQLLDDCRVLDVSSEDRFKMALPFAGIWSNDAYPRDLQMLIAMLVDQKRVDDVEFYYRWLMENEPKNALACGEFCQFLRSQQRMDEAIGLATTKIDTYPEMDDFRLILADLYLQNRQAKLAENTLNQVLENHPEHAGSLLRMGHSLQDQQKPDLAADYYQRAVAADPKIVEAHVELARTLMVGQKYEEARTALDRAIAVHPRHPGLHLTLAELHLRKRNLDDAIAEFRSSLELDDTIVAAHFQLARCLEQQGDRPGAEQHYEQAAIHGKSNPLVLNQWGIILAQRNDLARAIEYFKAALAVDPNFQAAKDNLSRAEQFIEGDND